MRLELGSERIAKLRKVLHYNGLPIDARSITDDILAQEGIEPHTPHRDAIVGGTLVAKGE
jgi:2-oxoglutarate ferredoxin oxidoreductase subunit alpha